MPASTSPRAEGADASALRPAVFLDRDGTVIHDREYLGEPGGVELLPGAGEAVARLNRAGFAVVLVTNQSGIGRGYFSQADYEAVHARLVELLAACGASLDGAYHCPHSPDSAEECDCRKPAAGLFRRAAAEHRIDLERSFYVGDRLRDILPARELGGRGILVGPGHAGDAGGGLPPGAEWAPSLADAVDRITASARAD